MLTSILDSMDGFRATVRPQIEPRRLPLFSLSSLLRVFSLSSPSPSPSSSSSYSPNPSPPPPLASVPVPIAAAAAALHLARKRHDDEQWLSRGGFRNDERRRRFYEATIDDR
ncbi:hypothetical protein Droror1_Dr00016180 [Drosera rotundifolia]